MEATLSSKNQIVVPKEAREALGARPGDKLLIVVRGEAVVILPRPASFTKALSGLARKRPYGASYLKKQRESWD